MAIGDDDDVDDASWIAGKGWAVSVVTVVVRKPLYPAHPLGTMHTVLYSTHDTLTHV